MKIEIEISNIELFSKALNNAFLAYGDIVHSINLGCGPQIITTKFLPLTKLSDNELRNRLEELKKVYLQIEEIERRILNDKRRKNYEPSA